MSLMNLLEKITGKQKQREKSRIDDFRSLVRAIGTGKEPDADKVDRILRETSKSVDELRAAVELYEKRFAMCILVNSLPKLEAERKDIEQQMAKANAALEEAERQHEETMNPLISQHEIVRQAMQEAERAKQQLVDTCPYEEFSQKQTDLHRRHAEAGNQAFKLRQTISELRAWARTDRANAPHATSAHGTQDLLQRADRRDAHAAQSEKELAEVTKQIASLEKQLQAVRDEMLVP